jgi:hypothetical protein
MKKILTVLLVLSSTAGFAQHKYVLKVKGGFDSSSFKSWPLTGATGVDPSKSFLGYTDRDTLNFKLNGNPVGYLRPGSVAFGLGAGWSDISGGSVYLGTYAGLRAQGEDNTAIGFAALAGTTTGFANTAVGEGALKDNIKGADNVALGSGAGGVSFYTGGLIVTDVNRCLFLGGAATTSKDSITSSIAIGYGAMVTKSRQIMLGSSLEDIQETVMHGNVMIPQLRPAISKIVSSATININTDTTNFFAITALASNVNISNPTGVRTNDGQILRIRIKDDGTARALSFDTKFRFSTDLSAPVTTVSNKIMYMEFIYEALSQKWDMINIRNNF